MTFTPVYDLRSKAVLGYIGDLTLKGVMIVGEKPVEVDRHIILGIEFPESVQGLASARVVIPSRAAWCRPEKDGQYFDIGFEFDELSADAATVIEAVLERYQFRSALDEPGLKP